MKSLFILIMVLSSVAMADEVDCASRAQKIAEDLTQYNGLEVIDSTAKIEKHPASRLTEYRVHVRTPYDIDLNYLVLIINFFGGNRCGVLKIQIL